MEETCKQAILRAERSKDLTISWAFGNLREKIEMLQTTLIAHVVRSPGVGFEGWQYLEKESPNRKQAVSDIEDILTAALELLRTVKE